MIIVPLKQSFHGNKFNIWLYENENYVDVKISCENKETITPIRAILSSETELNKVTMCNL